MDKEELSGALEDALRRRAAAKGEATIIPLSSIARINLKRGRVNYFLEGSQSARTLDDYLDHIDGFYQRYHNYLAEIQISRANAVWDPLYRQIKTLAYNFLARQSGAAQLDLLKQAEDCANDAAAAVLTAHFPYDSEFDAWLTVLVQHSCRQMINKERYQISRAQPLDEEIIAALPDENILEDAQLLALRQDIMEALRRLPNNRHKQVIMLRFLAEFSPAQTAEKTNNSVAGVNTMLHRALNDLRRVWVGNNYQRLCDEQIMTLRF